MNEAMYPLALITIGIYSEMPAPKKTGATDEANYTPRKYGSKGIKSIMRIPVKF
ncbi:MAG: hypothetical protein ACR5K4_03515 [Sodalis sp. (in: enterobacteria)]